MKKGLVVLAVAWGLLAAGPVFAHFGMLIPSQATVSKTDPKTVDLQVSFSHPMEMVGMDMAKPKAFGVMAGGSKEDLARRPEAGPGDGQGGLVRPVCSEKARRIRLFHGTGALLGTGRRLIHRTLHQGHRARFRR